ERPSKPWLLPVLLRNEHRPTLPLERIDGAMNRIAGNALPRNCRLATVIPHASAFLHGEHDRVRRQPSGRVPAGEDETGFERLQVEHLSAQRDTEIPRDERRDAAAIEQPS